MIAAIAPATARLLDDAMLRPDIAAAPKLAAGVLRPAAAAHLDEVARISGAGDINGRLIAYVRATRHLGREPPRERQAPQLACAPEIPETPAHAAL